jgi:urea carboxylase
VSAQVRFFEVSEGELEDLRERFRNGQYDIDIEHKTFSMAEYNEMLACESNSRLSMT